MSTFNPEEDYHKLATFYQEAETMRQWSDADLFTAQPEHSAWSPGQHVYHVAIVNGMMLKAIAAICRGSRIVVHEGEPNRIGRIVLNRQWMPRGKAQAPDKSHPPEDLTRAKLEQALSRSYKRFVDTEALLPILPKQTGRVPHPFMGMLTATEWMRNAQVHAHHHLKIIEDLRSPAVPS